MNNRIQNILTLIGQGYPKGTTSTVGGSCAAGAGVARDVAVDVWAVEA